MHVDIAEAGQQLPVQGLIMLQVPASTTYLAGLLSGHGVTVVCTLFTPCRDTLTRATVTGLQLHSRTQLLHTLTPLPKQRTLHSNPPPAKRLLGRWK
jgi:hypothetical protein